MRKAIGMFTSLIVALAMTGVAVAHWSDSVQIEGEAHMGDFLVGWLDVKECEDIDLHWPEPKEVADLTCELEDPETGVHHEPVQTVYHTLVVTVENAYPQYEAYCKVNLKNAGTIPAHIVDVIMTPGPGLEISYVDVDGAGNPIGWLLDNAETGDPVLAIELYKQLTELSLVCNQLEPCTAEPVDLWLEVIQDGAEECHTYEFSIEIIAWQWNKAGEYVPHDS